ncbi:DivIVA domain-containing protein [Weissella ceti]|nr:DivIVA domain-containing protein [Weissella ceti]
MITPQEIHAKQFTERSNKWFDKSEVTDFLDQLAIQLEEMQQENNNLRTRVSDADQNYAQVEEMKQSVNSSILIAQEAAERLKRQTEAEAEATLQQAQIEAQKIVMEANVKANALLTESQVANEELAKHHEGLENEMAAFKSHVESLIGNVSEMLSSKDWAEFQTKGRQASLAIVPEMETPVYETEAAVAEAPVVEEDKTETMVIFPDLEENNENFLNKD